MVWSGEHNCLERVKIFKKKYWKVDRDLTVEIFHARIKSWDATKDSRKHWFIMACAFSLQKPQGLFYEELSGEGESPLKRQKTPSERR